MYPLKYSNLSFTTSQLQVLEINGITEHMLQMVLQLACVVICGNCSHVPVPRLLGMRILFVLSDILHVVVVARWHHSILHCNCNFNINHLSSGWSAKHCLIHDYSAVPHGIAAWTLQYSLIIRGGY